MVVINVSVCEVTFPHPGMEERSPSLFSLKSPGTKQVAGQYP